jgi:spermidine/putrescine transport system permease protein
MPERSLASRWLSGHFGLVFAFLYAPVAVLMVLSFNASGQPFAWGGFSTRWYESLVDQRAHPAGGLATLIVGVVSTVVATTIGTLLALGLERTTNAPRARRRPSSCR